MKQEDLKISTLENLADYMQSQRVGQIHNYAELRNDLRFLKFDVLIILNMLYKFMTPKGAQDFETWHESLIDEAFKPTPIDPNKTNEETIQELIKEGTITVKAKDDSYENTYKKGE